MAKAPLEDVVRHIRKMVDAQTLTEATDGQLVERFVRSRDEPAFATLLRRHGPMVLGVSRRILRQLEDAEDVFQATFLLLARKAGSIRKRESVASWLHGVAYRLALRAKAQRTFRRAQEIRASAMRKPGLKVEEAWRELRPVFDEEMEKLPEKYRTALILCYLEGKTHEDVARQLGCPLGTVRSRVGRGRKLLQERLTRRGLTLSAGAFAAFLVSSTASATIRAQVLDSTLKACLQFGSAAALVSAPVAALVEEGLKVMLSTKLKIATALLLAVSLVAGAGALAHQVFEAKPSESKQHNGPQPAAKRPDSDIKEQARTDLYGDPLPPQAIARLGTVRFRHEGEATALAFTPDGKILVGYTHSGILIWDAATGKELHRLSVPRMPNQASGLGISPEGTTLAISENALGDDDTKVSLWELQTGKKTKTLLLAEGEGRRAQVNHLCFAPDGKTLAVSYTNQGKAVVFDLASGQVRASLGGRGAHFYNLAISPDSKTLAAAVDPNHSVQLWDIVTGKLIRAILTLPEMSAMSFVRAIGFSPDGKMLAVGLMDRIILSNAADGKELGQLEVKMGQVTGLAFTSDSKKLVSGSEGDGKVRVWEVATGKIVSTLGGRAGIGRSLALSPNGNVAALGTVGQTVQLWDVATGKELFTEYHGHDSQINSLAYSPDGKTLASAGDYRKILLWDTLSSQQKGILPGSARSLSFSADGKLLATVPAAYTAKVQIWDVAARKEASVITVPDTKDVKSAIFSPDGRKLFTLDWDYGGGPMLYYVRHWDLATGKQEQRWTIQHQTYTLSLVPDGKTVLAAVHRNFIIRDAETGRERLLRGPETHSVQTLLLSPDAKLLASGTNSEVRLWEVTTGKEISLLKGHTGSVTALAWSADGHMLASGDQRNNGPELATNQTVRLWDTATGNELVRFGGFRADVTALTFSPDRAFLLAGLADSTILIWEIPKRRP